MSSLKEVEAFWERVCFDPNFQPEGRFETYRNLVFEGMVDVMQNLCPVARGILGDREIKQLFWDFLKSAPPQSPVLRKLPMEVSQYLRREGHPLLNRYPYLGELMEYEYLEIQVRFAEETPWDPPSNAVVLNPAHALGIYTYPVHFISEKRRDPAQLPKGEYYLLLWREPRSLQVKFMEINTLVAEMIHQLEKNPLNSEVLLQNIALNMGLKPNEEYLGEGRKLIRDFADQGILRVSQI